MTTSIKSLAISFDLERHRTLRGDDDVRDALAKTGIEIHPALQMSALPDKFRPGYAPLQNFEPRIRHVPPPHLEPSSTANPHSTR